MPPKNYQPASGAAAAATATQQQQQQQQQFVCEACGKPSTMQCPKCREIGLTPSHYCSQTCFKNNWKTHKDKHTAEKPLCNIPTMTEIERAMFNFTGPLRPGLMSPKRFVPLTIARPDYADHPEGRAISEENDKTANKCKKVDAATMLTARRRSRTTPTTRARERCSRGTFSRSSP
jgi:hypothetical protein